VAYRLHPRSFRCLKPLLLAGTVLLPHAPATGAELYAQDGLTIRWDNMLRYTLASRIAPRDEGLLVDLNWDDGDRNFKPGLISNRLDLVSTLDVAKADWGLHASAMAWYDRVYRQGTDMDGLPAGNASTAAPGRFAPAVRDLYGQHAELRESFAYGTVTLADMPLTVRAGRQTLLWGESLFYDANSIAASQAPVDYTRPIGTQSAYSSDAYLPVGQVSLTVQPTADISLAFYHQLEWRSARLAGSGTYFSYLDQMGAGGDRLYLAPGRYLTRGTDVTPSAKGQYGASLHIQQDGLDIGLYALRYNAMDPQYRSWLRPGASGNVLGSYQLVYPGGVQLYGASFSTSAGDGMLSGELAYRRHMPLYLASTGYADIAGSNAYVKGDTLHGQFSLTTPFGRSALWDSADLNAEAALDAVLDHEQTDVRPQWKQVASKVRLLFEPRYFRVLPNLDLTVPIGLGYNISGQSLSYRVQNEGAADLFIGVTATYRSVWKASISLTHYMGSPTRQWLTDRDYVAVTLARTF
jgi:hypothetical protein